MQPFRKYYTLLLPPCLLVQSTFHIQHCPDRPRLCYVLWVKALTWLLSPVTVYLNEWLPPECTLRILWNVKTHHHPVQRSVGSSVYPNVDVLVVVVLSELVDIYIETDDDYTPDFIPDVLTTFECFNTGLQSPPLTTDRKGVGALRVDRHSCNFSDAIACKCTGS